jgi:hypothetical protein
MGTAERRAWGVFEIRERDGMLPTLAGYASVFDAPTDLGPFDEVVRPRAFRRALKTKQDVRALINHDSNLVLGRSASGTLRMTEDEKGLKVEIDPPDTQYARDLIAVMRRGDVSQMSFAFLPTDDGERVTRDDETGRRLRELTDVDLFDVSVVTYPAYADTSVALRSIEDAERRERSESERRAREFRSLQLRLALGRLSLTRKG